MKSRCQIYLNRRFSIKILMLRSNTAHLQSEDKFAEPPQELRARRRVQKKREVLSNFSFSTRSRGRTGTGVNLLVFETSASTDSAIRAGDSIFESGDKDIKKIRFQQFCAKNLQFFSSLSPKCTILCSSTTRLSRLREPEPCRYGCRHSLRQRACRHRPSPTCGIRCHLRPRG